MTDAGLISGAVPLECGDSLVVTVTLLGIVAAATYSGLRALFVGDDHAHTVCRWWAVTATTAVIAWYALSRDVPVEPRIPVMVAVSAASCWLTTLCWPPRQMPRATARPSASVRAP